MKGIDNDLHDVVRQLCEESSYTKVAHRANHEVPMPSIEVLDEFVELCRQVIFPGYFGNSELRPETMEYYIGTHLDKIYKLLAEQAKRGYCFECDQMNTDRCPNCDLKARQEAAEFIRAIPEIRRLCATDVAAAYEGDPAAKSYGEAIFCYPSILAVTNQRIAHSLITIGVPLIPRIITEMAHSKTGIDIHPGAQIGEKFFIDHGTGVVIGETCVIGNNVQLYQGVTLGAKNFPLDEHGNPIKGIPRHPIVEDDVVIYAQATVLGRITVGKGAVIGGNVWITDDVPAGARMMQSKTVPGKFLDGGGI
ncbi:MAG: serine acetyltransferase [Spirochaetes bacterium GWF1_49_6]|nr:MAG: serine acetyltransferase [Spirochaetes bacterium GWF1_49_6]